MTDIIFHIGFSKCASSTLQNMVFPLTKGYLGIGKKTSNEINFAKRFFNISPVGARFIGSQKRAKKWSEEVLKYKRKHYPNLGRLIVSNESFIGRNLMQRKPIIPFLNKFKNEVWKDNGSVKIIVVLRNQPEKIASTYAQLTKSNTKASQENFKKYVSKVLKHTYFKLDYASWVSSLYDNFGKQNVLVLLMEDINTLNYWESLKSFADLEELEPTMMINHKKRANKKKISTDTWKIIDYDVFQRARGLTNRYYNFFWPTHVFTKFRKKMIEKTIPLVNKIKQKQYKSNSLQREKSFKLTHEIRSEIQETYHDSNKLLAELLDRDLSKIGY